MIATISLRAPRLDEGAAMWELARDSERLDLNAPYAYMMWARDFHSTTMVADVDDDIVGFITGYWRPDSPTTLMVWQVAVDERHRGRGIAGRMLDALAERTGAAAVETTITRANEASVRLFSSFAERRGAEHEVTSLFGVEHFPGDDGWEPELLHRIAPLRTEPREDTDALNAMEAAVR